MQNAVPVAMLVGIAILVPAGILSGHSPKETAADRVARLIEQLGNDGFAKREAATEELEAIGEPALDALRKAAASDEDLEVRRRAERVIRTIAARTGKKELAKWAGFWKTADGVWMEITGVRWSSATPTWGPVSGRVVITDVEKRKTAADFFVEEGPTKGQTCLAIFRLDGDTLHYCGTYSSVRATEFKNVGNYYSCAFKRAKKETAEKSGRSSIEPKVEAAPRP